MLIDSFAKLYYIYINKKFGGICYKVALCIGACNSIVGFKHGRIDTFKKQ